MKLTGFLIVTRDIERAKRYYQALFGLEVLADNDGNVALSGGLFLQDERYWKTFLGREIRRESNACELYFEEPDIDGFVDRLERLYPDTVFVNRPMTHSWGQRVVRFYDPDGHLIEVGTPMDSAD